MQSVKLLSSELMWCTRCSYRFSRIRTSHLERHTVSALQILQRQSSAEAIPLPKFEDEAKEYPPKIQKLVDEISQLSLIEVADLNELLKKTLKIADVPAMFSAAPAAQASVKDDDASDEPVKQEKTLFTVKLVKYDETKKVAVIKEVKNIVAGMNLVQAKKFVESLPQTLKLDVSKEECEQLKVALEAVGGLVEIE